MARLERPQEEPVAPDEFHKAIAEFNIGYEGLMEFINNPDLIGDEDYEESCIRFIEETQQILKQLFEITCNENIPWEDFITELNEISDYSIAYKLQQLPNARMIIDKIKQTGEDMHNYVCELDPGLPLHRPMNEVEAYVEDDDNMGRKIRELVEAEEATGNFVLEDEND